MSISVELTTLKSRPANEHVLLLRSKAIHVYPVVSRHSLAHSSKSTMVEFSVMENGSSLVPKIGSKYMVLSPGNRNIDENLKNQYPIVV